MIKSLVDPKNPEVVTPREVVDAMIKELGPNDMLIWCKKDPAGRYSYIVGDYKTIRCAVYSFGDAMKCASAFLGALTHYERVIDQCDKDFEALEECSKRMNEIFINMANKKAKAEAKQRRDNPMPMPMDTSNSISPEMMMEMMEEIHKAFKIPKDKLGEIPLTLEQLRKTDLYNLTDKELDEAFNTVARQTASAPASDFQNYLGKMLRKE